MGTHRQRLWDFFATSRTSLGCAAGIHPKYFPTSVFCFVGKKLEEFAPTTIRDRFAQVSVLDHVLDLQVFNVDSLEIVNVFIGNLMQKIVSLISHFLMRLGDQYSRLVSAYRAFSPSGKFPLSTPKLFFTIAEIFRIRDLTAFTIYTKRFYSNVNTYLFAGLRELFSGYVVAGKGNKPFTRRHTSDSDGLNVSLNRAGEKELEPAHVFDVEISTFERISCLFKGEGIVAVSVLEAWKSCFFSDLYSTEKSLVCLIKALKHVLKCLGVGNLNFRKIFLNEGQLFRLVVSRDRFFSSLVSINPLPKRRIVDIATDIKPVIAITLCFPVYFRTIYEGFSHLDVLLVFDILLNHRQRRSAASDDAIAVSPERRDSSPKCPEFLSHYPGCVSLDILNEPVDAELWVYFYQKMYMVCHHLKLYYLRLKLGRLLAYELLKPYSNVPAKNLAPIFRTPNHMVLAGENNIVVGF